MALEGRKEFLKDAASQALHLVEHECLEVRQLCGRCEKETRSGAPQVLVGRAVVRVGDAVRGSQREVA